MRVSEIVGPAWLEFPDDQIEPKKVELWTCGGRTQAHKKRPWWRRKPARKTPGIWTHLYQTKEEAESKAASVNGLNGWEWRGEPAYMLTLEEAMLLARQAGRDGVVIEAWRDGIWVTVRKFPCDVPYFGDKEGG